MVVVEVEVVVSQYNKNLPSLSDVVGSSAPDSSLGSESDSASKELCGIISPASPENPSTTMLLFFLFPQATKPELVDKKHTVDVDTEEVVEELDTKKSFGCLVLEKLTLDTLISKSNPYCA